MRDLANTMTEQMHQVCGPVVGWVRLGVDMRDHGQDVGLRPRGEFGGVEDTFGFQQCDRWCVGTVLATEEDPRAILAAAMLPSGGRAFKGRSRKK